MKRILTVLLLNVMSALCGLSGSLHRQALIIGNDSYPGNGLQNARHDAQAVSDSLGSMGYTTMLQMDVTRRVLQDSVDIFANGLTPGDTAVVYYSGHGLQIDGENYLVPIDFKVGSPSDVRYQGYPLSQVVDTLARHGASTQIIILDSCRDNPFLGTRSLGRGWAGMSISAGTFLAFGTAPGSTASDNPSAANGLFTEALLKYLRAPGLDINAMFEKVREDVIRESNGLQVPWIASSLIGSFYVSPDGETTAASQPYVGVPNSARFFSARSMSPGDSSTYQSSQSDSVPILINEGLLLAQQQNYDEAIRSLSAAVAADSKSSIALRILGLIFHLMGRSTDAVSEFNQALSANPRDATAYYYRCLATAPTDAMAATRDCQAAIGLEPEFPEAHLGLANAFYVLGRSKDAFDEANTAIRLAPTSPLGYSMRGKISASLGQYIGAQRDFDTAVRMRNPDVQSPQ